jgi:beta-mannosidase
VNGDWDPYPLIRKAACNFGWDWGPKVATCGIWKEVRLEGWSGARIVSVVPRISRDTSRDGNHWTVGIRAALEWSGAGAPVEVHARLDTGLGPLIASEAVAHGAATAAVQLDILEPKLWHSNGQGPRTRYPLTVELRAADGPAGTPPLADRTMLIGFRDLQLKTEPDAAGSTFTFEINGKPLFCKGANWIPDGLFPARMTRERTRERLMQAAAANMNMIRVWGGGVYESDDFYDLCDELGILVWQDFMFACAMYPEEPPFPSLIEAEARHQVARLAYHPCLALWCGGNECIWGYESWGYAPGETPWKDRVGTRTWGHGFYHDLLPRVITELDPGRPYWPNSPWSGSEMHPPNDADRGDRHTWDARGDALRTITPRFCSELGHQSPPNYSTLAAAIGAAPSSPDSRELHHRQHATGGTPAHIDAGIAELFGSSPRTFDEWHYLAQLAQARSLRTGIEWLRTQQPRCMGALVWQLNDAWPGMSWSFIDSAGLPKPAYFAVQAAFENRLLTIQPIDGHPRVFAVNDTGEPWRLALTLTRMRFDGSPLASVNGLGFTIPPRSAPELCDTAAHVGNPSDPASELLIASAMKRTATWFFAPDRELAYPSPRIESKYNRDLKALRCVARTLIRDAVLTLDRAHVPGLAAAPLPTTLLPGDTFSIQTPEPPTPEQIAALTSPPVLWCANRFGRATP